jgi:hypothetical protein
MMRRSVPGNRFPGSQPGKARGRGHCQAVRRLAAWFWERWIFGAGRWGETRRLTRLFPIVVPKKFVSAGSVGSLL